MLLEAKNPLMSVGDEASWYRASKELIELAELIGLPVTGQGGSLGFWSKPFPTRHPLYIGPQLRDMRYPGKVDVLLNLGNRYGERPAPGAQLISIRLDPTSLARGGPVDLGMVADVRLAAADGGDRRAGDSRAAQGDRRGAHRPHPRLQQRDVGVPPD